MVQAVIWVGERPPKKGRRFMVHPDEDVDAMTRGVGKGCVSGMDIIGQAEDGTVCAR